MAKLWFQRLSPCRAWLLVGLTILLVVAVRVRLREMPLERDEGEYAYAGQLMLQGVPPYTVAYNMKLPGTYAAYALIMAVFGQNPAAIHIGVMLVNVASIVLLFLLGRKLLDDATGVVAAASYALMSLSPSVLGLAGHATHFVVVFALAGILLLVNAVEGQSKVQGPRSKVPTAQPRIDTDGHGLQKKEDRGQRSEVRGQRTEGRGQRSEDKSRWSVVSWFRDLLSGRLLSSINHPLSTLFASGLVLGLAFLMKQHGIFFGLFGVLFLLWIRFEKFFATDGKARSQLKTKNSKLKTDLPSRTTHHASRTTLHAPAGYQLSTINYQLLALALGFALPYVLTCLFLWCSGAFHQFWFWTITYAYKYASAIPLVKGPELLRSALRAVVGPNLVFWLLPWAGALLMWWENRLVARYRFFLAALFVCSLGSISVGFLFREHYFLTLLPVLALLTGVAVSRSLHLVRTDRSIELFVAAPILLFFFLGLGGAILGGGSFWFGMTPAETVRNTYGTTLFSEAMNAADYIRTNSAKEARVAVLGSEPEIYFYSSRRSATGYIYTYPLMETHPYALKMQEEMLGEIEARRPEYVVYVDEPLSWLKRRDSERRIFDWWETYRAGTLDLVTSFPFVDEPENENDSPRTRYLHVYKRKAAPEKQ